MTFTRTRRDPGGGAARARTPPELAAPSRRGDRRRGGAVRGQPALGLLPAAPANPLVCSPPPRRSTPAPPPYLRSARAASLAVDLRSRSVPDAPAAPELLESRAPEPAMAGMSTLDSDEPVASMSSPAPLDSPAPLETRSEPPAEGGSDAEARAEDATSAPEPAGEAEGEALASEGAPGGVNASVSDGAAGAPELAASGSESGGAASRSTAGGAGANERPGAAAAAERGPRADVVPHADIIRPPQARLGGIEPARVGPVPPLTPAQRATIVRRTALDPAEHHVRVRGLLARLADRAHRSQVTFVDEVKSSATFERLALERRAALIPNHVNRAVARVRAAYGAARAQVSEAASHAFALIEENADSSDRLVDEAALTSAEMVQNGILSSSLEVQALHESTMGPVRTLLRTKAEEMSGVGELKAQGAHTAGVTLSADLMVASGGAIERAQNEAKSQAVPQLATNVASSLRQAGIDGAADVRAQEPAISLSFLSLVNPAAVHVEEIGGEDEETMTCTAVEVRTRIATDYERAKRFVELTRDRTLDQLRRAEQSSVEQLYTISRRIQAQARVRIANLVNGMLHAAPAGAEAWRSQMASINRSIVPGTFLNVRQLEPRLLAGEAGMRTFAAQQQAQFEKQTRDGRAGVLAGFAEDLEGVRTTADDAIKTARETAAEQTAAMRGISQSFANGFRGVAEPASSEAASYAIGVEEKLGAQEAQVRREMTRIVGTMDTSLSEAVTHFGEQLQEHVTNLREVIATDLAAVDADVVANLEQRSGTLYRAMDGPGTDEGAVFSALHSLTSRRAAALEEFWDHGDDLRGWLWDDLSGDEYNSAIAYLNGNAVEGARLELRSEMHWYGNDTSQMETALRALTPEQMGELRSSDDFAAVHTEIQSSLRGTDLNVMESLIAGRVARADALRLREQVDRARRSGNDDALHDALAAVDAARLPEVRREFAHLTTGGSLTEDATITNDAASAEFTRYITADVQVEHHDPETGHTWTTTMRLTGPGRDLAVALAREGEGSPQARAARLAFEVARGGSPRLERIGIATDDPELVAARARSAAIASNAEVSRHERARADAELRRVEARRDQMNQEFARLRGAEAETQADAGRSAAFTETAMRGLFDDDHLGQRLGLSMLRDGRANPALAIRYAVRGAGTDEALIRRTLRTMRPDEIAQLRRDYGAEFGNGADDIHALDRALGTYGHGGFFTELSGDERQEVEEMLVGVPQNDRDRLALARVRARHHGESTWLGRGASAAMGLFSGSDPAAEFSANYARLERMVEQAGGDEVAFGPDGNFAGTARFDRNAFLVTAGRVGEAAQNYKARIDSIANIITGAIALIGAIVGTIVVTVLSAGTATPFVVGAWAAGIAALTGAAAMAVNYGLKGGRYGWEQAGIDAALTLLDAATAGLMAGASVRGLRAAAALRSATLARTPAQVASAARIAAQQQQRELVRGFIRAAATSGLSGGARTAAQDGTWDDGILEGFGRVVAGSAKAAAIGVVTHGVSTGFARSGVGQRLGSSLSYVGRGMGQGIGGALGSMAGRTVELGIDQATGNYHGTWYDALGAVAQAGGRGFVENFAQGMAEVPHARRQQAATERANAARLADEARIARQGAGPEDAAADAAFRMQALRDARAVDPRVNPREFLRDLDAAVTGDRARAEATRQLQRALRTEALAGIPPERRAEFANVPIRLLSDAEFEAFTGSQSGRAVTIFDNGEAQIIVRRSATPEVMREEGLHLLQSRDPKWAARVSAHDERNLAGWHRMDVEAQVALYRNKLDIEIDAQQRLRVSLLAEAEHASPQRRAELLRRVQDADATLAALHARSDEVAALPPERLAAIRAGKERPPQYLREPPRLFSKGPAGDPQQLPPTAAPARLPRADDPELQPTTRQRQGGELRHEDADLGSLPRRPIEPENTTWSEKHPGKRFQQVGDFWIEQETVTVNGRSVTRDRAYRMIEVLDTDGVTVLDRRREILQLEENTPNYRWQQRGSESTARGRVFEEAVRLRNMAEAENLAGGAVDPNTASVVPIGAIRDRAGERLSAQHGGGAGFDDVVIIFRQENGRVTAHLRLIEAKDYGGALGLEDFSAVTTNLRQNLQVVAERLARSNLSYERRVAVLAAIRANDVSIDVHVSRTTSVGDASTRSNSVLKAVARTALALEQFRAVERALRVRRGNTQDPDEIRRIDLDIGRVTRLRDGLDEAFRHDPFSSTAARDALDHVLDDGTFRLSGIARRQGVTLDDQLPGIRVRRADETFDGLTVEQFQAEAAVRANARRVLGQPLGAALGAAEAAGLAAPAARVANAEVVAYTPGRLGPVAGDDAIAVGDAQGRAIVVARPKDLAPATDGASPAADRLVTLMRSPIELLHAQGAASTSAAHVIWDAGHASPADVGQVLANVRRQMRGDPEMLGKVLRTLIPTSSAGSEDALRAALGLGELVDITRVNRGPAGDFYVVAFRNPPPPPSFSFRGPVARHFAVRVDQRTVAKELNTVVEKGVDVAGDVEAINAGLATRTGNTFTIGGRTYGMHDGVLYPMSGPGLHPLNRPAFKALGVLNQFGDSERATAILDKMGTSAADREAALAVWRALQ